MRQLDLRHAFSIALVLFVLGIGALFVGAPQPVRAQLSSVVTWIPASGVGGTGNAVTLAMPDISSMNDLLGVPVRFLPSNTNVAGGTTILVNNNSAVNVLRVSGGTLVPIAGGDFTTGSPGPFVEVVYDGTEFVDKNPATGDAPVGSEIVLTNAPSSCSSSPLTCIPGYLVESGICISETTYSALYAWYGSSDVWSPGSTGAGCSSGQFHLKFANGRASVASNTQGSQTGPLTLCTAGVGNTCGSQSLAQSALPNVAPGFTGTAGTATSQTAGFFDYSGISPSSTAITETPGTPDATIVFPNGVSPSIGTILSNFTPQGTVASINGNVTQTASENPINQNIFAVKY